MKKVTFVIFLFLIAGYNVFAFELIFESRNFAEAKTRLTSEALSMSNTFTRNNNVLNCYYIIGSQQMTLSAENRAKGTYVIFKVSDFALIYIDYNTGKKVVIVFHKDSTTFPGEKLMSRDGLISSISEFLPD